MTDHIHLRRTFALATEAIEKGARPFAALIVVNDEVRLSCCDQVEWRNSPTAHPEIEILRNFCERFGKTELGAATLYTNVEPCPMCAGAILYSGIGRMVYSLSRNRFDEWISRCRVRPRKRCIDSRLIIRNGGLTQVVGPLIEEEGLNLVQGHSFPYSHNQPDQSLVDQAVQASVTTAAHPS